MFSLSIFVRFVYLYLDCIMSLPSGLANLPYLFLVVSFFFFKSLQYIIVLIVNRFLLLM
jgi:hypothetical protein